MDEEFQAVVSYLLSRGGSVDSSELLDDQPPLRSRNSESAPHLHHRQRGGGTSIGRSASYRTWAACHIAKARCEELQLLDRLKLSALALVARGFLLAKRGVMELELQSR